MSKPASRKKITMSELSLLLCCNCASREYSLRLLLSRLDCYHTEPGNFSPFLFILFSRPFESVCQFFFEANVKVLSAERFDALFPLWKADSKYIFFPQSPLWLCPVWGQHESNYRKALPPLQEPRRLLQDREEKTCPLVSNNALYYKKNWSEFVWTVFCL